MLTSSRRFDQKVAVVIIRRLTKEPRTELTICGDGLIEARQVNTCGSNYTGRMHGRSDVPCDATYRTNGYMCIFRW